ncbi:MAG: DUF393 domain-containing protein [Proteobacteria bacterium]|nr:DUF393 domain-containing protein [Pseudomonadota bacterium]
MALPPSAPHTIGWVLYDDDCGVCRWLAEHAKGMLARRGFALAALQEDWVAPELGLPASQVAVDFRLLCVDGRRFAGADVYRQIFKRIWWCWPLYLFSVVPGLAQIFNWAYATFRDNRGRLSKSCGLG